LAPVPAVVILLPNCFNAWGVSGNDMTDRKLFWTNKSVDHFTKNFEKIETENSFWEVVFVDKITNQEWLRYAIDERGFRYNLIPFNPLLTTTELVEIALTSKYLNEVAAAAFRLYYEEEYEHRESRQYLISRLQEKLIDIPYSERKRVSTIIKEAQLLNKVNRREIHGKHYTEIEADAKYFRDTADAALEILKKLRS
jgi:hypothetical protein